MASKGCMLFADSSSNGEIRLNAEAVEVLASLPQPLKVVSIFGPRHSGKSYLLNLLAGSNEFIVSSDSCKTTPCIYMWSLPDPLDSKQNLVLLDCEGFEEDLVLEERAYSPIFTLSVLLSSVCLYNTLGPVKRETLDQLFHITMLRNLVILPSEDHANERFLPEFVWCVRDESLVMNFGSIELDPEDFLDSVLNDIKDGNSPAGHLLEIFTRPKMKLLDFCTPHAYNKDYESLSLSELSPNFTMQIDALRKFLYRSKPKALADGHYASGRELVILLETFVENVSTGSIMDLNQVTGFSVLEVSGKDFSGDLPRNTPVVWSNPSGSLPSGVGLPASGREEKASVFSGTGKMLEPICLIENTTNNELKVNQEAVAILSSFHQPVVVVSIVGMYRTGKSYLMNRLAGKHKGFALGSTIQSKTKGIWMWCVSVPGREEQTLVLLDSEGLGDVEKGDEKNDHWIFSLAVLLSSTLIYNSIGTINNIAVMNLQYVTELTKHIKVKSNNEDEADASAEYVRFFPSFIWAVRDFTLELEANGKPITADEYLENSLKLKPGHNKNVATSNSARECIRKYFPRRKCFVFDTPVHRDKLKIIDQLSDSDLEEKFVKQATEFCSYVLGNSQVKTIKGGIKVTGRLLAKLVMMYVDTIKSGKVPCLENAVVALAQTENSKAVEEAHSLYKQLLSEWTVLHTETQEELSNVHEICLKEALQLFLDRSFKDDDRRFQTQLMDLVRNEYDKKCQENEELSLNYCTALLMQLEDTLKPDNDYMTPGGYQDFQQDLEVLIVQYRDTKGRGIKAEQALEEYLAKKNKLGKVILAADRSISEQQKRIEEQQAYAKMQEVNAKAAEVEKVAVERRIEDVKRAQEENKRQLMEKIERERKDMQSEHERVLQQKLREQNAMLQQGFDANARQMQGEIDQLRREMSQAQNRSRGRGGCTIS
uniref:Guanylate-binding protein 1-like n=1 Tax=Paramormyrops kingsleyae TaxID=1676925 RepID=A0A3B3QYM6_9TELE|nr:guanylate-binding protein 1-like isoform X1 [Paramormyrops kingsleyae]